MPGFSHGGAVLASGLPEYEMCVFVEKTQKCIQKIRVNKVINLQEKTWIFSKIKAVNL